jgi:hypothetical protein
MMPVGQPNSIVRYMKQKSDRRLFVILSHMQNHLILLLPTVKVLELLLKSDPHLLFMMDVRGSLPLSYLQEKDYVAFKYFLISKKDEIWPIQNTMKNKGPPPLTLQLANTRPIRDPSIVLPNSFIEMMASGRMSPKEISILHDLDDDLSNDDIDDIDASFGGVSFGGYTFDVSETSSILSDESSFSSSTSCGFDDVSALIGNGVSLSKYCNDEGKTMRSTTTTQSSTSVETKPSSYKDKAPIPVGRSMDIFENDKLSLATRSPKINCETLEIIPSSTPSTKESRIDEICSIENVDNTTAITNMNTKRSLNSMHISTKGNYCMPETDDGLLFGSC